MTTVARPAAASATTAADRNQPRSAAPAQQPALPSVHMRVLLTWIAVFTALTVVQLVVGPYVKGFPMLLRTLVITGIVVAGRRLHAGAEPPEGPRRRPAPPPLRRGTPG